jgi:hypothetical protein
MVLVTDLSVFEQRAQEMIRQSPKKTRLTTKIRKSPPVFTMKVTNGPQCYKIKITKEVTIKLAQRVIGTLTGLMTSNDLI